MKGGVNKQRMKSLASLKKPAAAMKAMKKLPKLGSSESATDEDAEDQINLAMKAMKAGKAAYAHMCTPENESSHIGRARSIAYMFIAREAENVAEPDVVDEITEGRDVVKSREFLELLENGEIDTGVSKLYEQAPNSSHMCRATRVCVCVCVWRQLFTEHLYTQS